MDTGSGTLLDVTLGPPETHLEDLGPNTHLQAGTTLERSVRL